MLSPTTGFELSDRANNTRIEEVSLSSLIGHINPDAYSPVIRMGTATVRTALRMAERRTLTVKRSCLSPFATLSAGGASSSRYQGISLRFAVPYHYYMMVNNVRSPTMFEVALKRAGVAASFHLLRYYEPWRYSRKSISNSNIDHGRVPR